MGELQKCNFKGIYKIFTQHVGFGQINVVPGALAVASPTNLAALAVPSILSPAKHGLFQSLSRLAPKSANVRRLGLPIRLSEPIRRLWRIKSIALLILRGSSPTKRNVFQCLGSRPSKNCMFGHSWHREARKGHQRIDELYNQTSTSKTFQKVRSTLCSLSAKQFQTWPSGRSPQD